MLFDYLEDGLSKRSPRTMWYKDQLLMTLVKLRLNTQFDNLADSSIPPKVPHSMHVKLKVLLNGPSIFK